MPTIEHVIFIPAVLILGLVLGYVLGARATREEMARQTQRSKR